MNIGSRITNQWCSICVDDVVHENGECITCKTRRIDGFKGVVRKKYHALTLEQKIDYLFEELIVSRVGR